MKKIPRRRSKQWLTGAAAGLATFTGGEQAKAVPWVDISEGAIRRAAQLQRFATGYEGVLGTSLDLIVETARPAEAAECERRVLAEIERLRRILSTYDPASEISRVIAGVAVESPELAEVLAAYDQWAMRTDGLIDLNLGGVVTLWREAARSGRLPERETLARALREKRAWNVDALGKGFVIERAVAVARRIAPGGAVNLGGDIRVWGDTAWTVAVADPRNPAENAPPLARFALHEAAVASSGGYARGYDVAGSRFSHLIDPRTGWALAPGGGATVVAGDAVTANALSTAASIGGFDTGAHLAEERGAAGYVFADADGRVQSGGIFVPVATAAGGEPAQPGATAGVEKAAAPAPAVEWPKEFQVTVNVALKKFPNASKQIYRPYVVVWVQNEKGHLVRTVAVWGDDQRWQRRLRTWWNAPSDTNIQPEIKTRATRPAGEYSVVWNGLDDFGRRLPAGTYTVCLEVCREEGSHVIERVKFVCGQETATGTFRETAETDVSTVTYGPAPAGK